MLLHTVMIRHAIACPTRFGAGRFTQVEQTQVKQTQAEACGYAGTQPCGDKLTYFSRASISRTAWGRPTKRARQMIEWPVLSVSRCGMARMPGVFW